MTVTGACPAKHHLRSCDWKNPPILHRKGTFVAADYPGRDKFARLTAQEDRNGLYAVPATIGTRNRWMELLESKGLELRGHRLVRRHDG